MIFSLVSRFIQQIAQRAIKKFIRCSCFIVKRLHVHSDHGLTAGRMIANPPTEAGRTGTQPPTKDGRIGTLHLTKVERTSDPSTTTYPDVFENPGFIGSDYKDDRAAVNLDKISSHGKNTYHAKSCQCKPCRDQRHTSPKSGSGRHRGYHAARMQAQMAPSNPGPLLPSASPSDTQCRRVTPNRPPSKQPPSIKAQRQASKRRRLDLANLQCGSNRFALLPVERTEDEEDHQLDLEDLLEDDGLRIFNTSWADVPPKRRAPTPFPLASWTPLLDCETESEPDDGEPDDSDFDNNSPSTPPSLSPTTTTTIPQNKSFQLPLSPHLNNKHPHPRTPSCPCHIINLAPSDTATDGGSDTSADHSKLMPWEEDDWDAERKELGVRALGWTSTRTVGRYRQVGGGDVEVFVGEAEWL